MKKNAFITIMALCTTLCMAQKKTVSIDYTPFIGTWIYQNNDTIFRINLKPIITTSRALIIHRLWGGYSISIHNTLIDNCIGLYPDSLIRENNEEEKYNIGIDAFMYSLPEDESYLTRDKIKTIFYDKQRMHNKGNGIGGGHIVSISNDSIHWYLDEKKGARQKELKFENLGFSVPTDVIMIREK